MPASGHVHRNGSAQRSLADRRPQAFEVECLCRPFDDNSLGWITQVIATLRHLLAPAVGISDLYAVIADVRPYHPSAAPQGVLLIQAPGFLSASIVVTAARPRVAATWPRVAALPELPPEPLPDPELP